MRKLYRHGDLTAPTAGWALFAAVLDRPCFIEDVARELLKNSCTAESSLLGGKSPENRFGDYRRESDGWWERTDGI